MKLVFAYFYQPNWVVYLFETIYNLTDGLKHETLSGSFNPTSTDSLKHIQAVYVLTTLLVLSSWAVKAERGGEIFPIWISSHWEVLIILLVLISSHEMLLYLPYLQTWVVAFTSDRFSRVAMGGNKSTEVVWVLGLHVCSLPWK